MTAIKVPIQTRARSEDRDLIDRVATALGKTRSDFVMDSATTAAIDVLLEQRKFYLNASDFAFVLAELDQPPSEKLVALLRSKPVWDR